MNVKDGLKTLEELNSLYDNFVVFTDEHKADDISPMLHDICIALSDYRYFLKNRINNTEVLF